MNNSILLDKVSTLKEKLKNNEKLLVDNLSDEEFFSIVEEKLLKHPEVMCLANRDKIFVIDRVFYGMRKSLDFLEEFIKDNEVSEIMVNGPDNVFIEKKGEIKKVRAGFCCKFDLEEVMRRIAHQVKREINTLNPILSARLQDGSRAHCIYSNISMGGPSLTIRKFLNNEIDVSKLVSIGTLTEDSLSFLGELIEAGYNIFISGGTSSGKTTLLNALSSFIPKTQRVIVIEDSMELDLLSIDNIVRLECKPKNTSKNFEIGMKDLIKASLRMRPDRIIVGEVRGEEIIQMVQAMNTGHSGSLGTGHGSSVRGMLRRMETMFLQGIDFPISAIRQQIAQAIDIMIQIERFGSKRKVIEISEIVEDDRKDYLINPLFKLNSEMELVRTDNLLQSKEKLVFFKKRCY